MLHYTDRNWHAEFIGYVPHSWTLPAPVRATPKRGFWATLFHYFTR